MCRVNIECCKLQRRQIQVISSLCRSSRLKWHVKTTSAVVYEWQLHGFNKSKYFSQMKGSACPFPQGWLFTRRHGAQCKKTKSIANRPSWILHAGPPRFYNIPLSLLEFILLYNIKYIKDTWVFHKNKNLRKVREINMISSFILWPLGFFWALTRAEIFSSLPETNAAAERATKFRKRGTVNNWQPQVSALAVSDRAQNPVHRHTRTTKLLCAHVPSLSVCWYYSQLCSVM